MSAIWALLQRTGQPVAPADLQRMGEALAAWGGAPCIWQQGTVGVGCRLMPFTPEDRLERQPLTSGDGSRVVVVDGRLDNRSELAQEWGLSPADLRGWPDSAFVLQAIEIWGADAPRHLIGALAFIAWDGRTQTLLAASTPGNKRILYYAQTDQLIAIATVPAGLLALPAIPRTLNLTHLASYLRFERNDTGETFFQGLQRLPSGHTLSANASEFSIERYWMPETLAPIRFARDADYVEAFQHLFERVVADQLRSEHPVAIFLSGGLDSASVAATAAPQLADRGSSLAAYTEVPAPGGRTLAPGHYADETEYVQALAAAYPNLQPHWVRTDGAWFVSELPEFFRYHAAPLRAASNLVWLQTIMRLASAAGEKTVLTGDFGNLSLSWSGDEVIADAVRGGRLRAAWREASALAAGGGARSGPQALWARGILPLLPETVQLGYARLRRPDVSRSFSPARADFLQAQGQPSRAGWGPFSFRPVGPGPQVRLDAALRRIDGTKTAWSGQFGLDVRDPTADQRVIEFCLAIPAEQFLRDGQPRWLIRRAMQGRLPEAVRLNRQRGLQAADWFQRLSARQAEIAGLLQQFGRDDLVRSILDMPRLQRLLTDWPATLTSGQPAHLDYRRTLTDGLMLGCYLMWFQGQTWE